MIFIIWTKHSSKYIVLCFTEEAGLKEHEGWVNDKTANRLLIRKAKQTHFKFDVHCITTTKRFTMDLLQEHLIFNQFTVQA